MNPATLLLTFTLCLFTLVSPSYAQGRNATAEFLIRELPAPGLPPRIIDGASLDSFRPLIPAELFELFSMGVTVEALNSLPFVWKYDEAWTKNSSLSPLGDPKGITATHFARGFPFGNAEVLDRESDPAVAGQRILWNVLSHTLMQKLMGVDIRFAVVREWAEEKVFEAKMLRAYPGVLQEENKTGQFQRELLTVSSPVSLAGLARLTFRFFGEDEDVLWGYSPAIQKTRQLAGSNRSDPFLFSAISLDDLFTWSGKVEWVDARREGTVKALVPFSQRNIVRAQSDGGLCIKVEGGAATQDVSFNVRTKKFLDALPWTPTGSYFVPRSLWRLTLSNLDPFSRYGRQVLYVDTETQLPVYKIVYAPSGEPIKAVFSSFVLAGLDDKSVVFPIPAYTVAVDLVTKQGSILEYSNYFSCTSVSDILNLGTFDPRKMGIESDGSTQ